MKENWDNFWVKNKDTRFTSLSWSKKRMIEVLNKYMARDLVVLDAGSGSGFFSNYFLSKGCSVYSLDYSESALEITKISTNNKCARYLKRGLLDPKLGNEYRSFFDVIFSDGLFEHFSENEQNLIMENFLKMKKPQGLIMTFVPNRFSLWQLIRPFFMPQIREIPFIWQKLKKLYAKLEILQQGGINILPIKWSPDAIAGKYLGMILYIIGR